MTMTCASANPHPQNKNTEESLERSQFMTEDIRYSMKLNDLETGMIVETANGTLLLVVKFPRHFMGSTVDRAISNECWVDLGHYNQDFSRLECIKEYDPVNRDIVAVYKPKDYIHYKKTLSDLLNKENLVKIFDVEYRKPMTLEEIEKELGCKVSIQSNQSDIQFRKR